MASRTGRQFQRYNHGSRQVVGCIPYRKINQSQPSIHGTLIEEYEVLMISSQKSPRMMFPKGGWETDESMEEAASRETLEEAGVTGHVEGQLGTWNFESKSTQAAIHEGHMFPMLVTEEKDDWPEKNVRRRLWVSVQTAREVCVHLWMKEALNVLVDRLVNLPRTNEEHGYVLGDDELMQLPKNEEEPQEEDLLVDQHINKMHVPRKEEEESLGVLVNRVMHRPRKEEECRTTPCSIEFLSEPRRRTIIIQTAALLVDSEHSWCSSTFLDCPFRAIVDRVD